MRPSRRAAAYFMPLVAATFSFMAMAQAQSPPLVRRVQVMGDRNPVEIEIEGSERLVPEAQVLTGPDRLVVDFQNAVPDAKLRNQKWARGDVKGVRVGLFSAKPPVTRVVFDLNGPQAYQLFPAGRTVIVKLGGGAGLSSADLKTGSGAKLVPTGFPAPSVQITPPAPVPPLVVSFQNGLLRISSNKASLSEVLFAVHQRTGAEIAIPAGAEQEVVVAEIGPGAAPEVLSSLLTGSKFNFLILSSAADSRVLDRVILSARPEGPTPAYNPQPQVPARVEPVRPVEENEPEPAAIAPPPGGNPNVNPNPGTPVNPGAGANENPPD